MLTSITPLGERGRGQRWGLTATALTIGHLIGGAALGGLLAGLSVLRERFVVEPDPDTLVAVLALIVIVAAVFDLAGGQLPGRRQVDETWLTTYRGWVYGLGFGVQLGLGFVTVVNTALFVAMVAAGVLVDPSVAFFLGVLYGAVRAVLAIANARVRTIPELKALHRRLDAVDARVRVGGAATAAMVGAVAAGLAVA